ncbi:15151_t:CDS:2 [Racocetra persica]|uniref:15151_t:CDS:1 n=1 Tax=Racocetra persica TaxID=160502 RepID=A0ACA9LHN4_9GLOM|nr:15151_t:CDS:2 [Racocetra persica]
MKLKQHYHPCKLYDYYLQEIETRSVNVLGLAINSFEANTNNDKYQSDKESKETQLDWMILAKTYPNNQLYNSLDFGSHNIDLGYN